MAKSTKISLLTIKPTDLLLLQGVHKHLQEEPGGLPEKDGTGGGNSRKESCRKITG
jgi:hypothetical protein